MNTRFGSPDAILPSGAATTAKESPLALWHLFLPWLDNQPNPTATLAVNLYD
jgi:hypothetical protein